MSTSPSVPRPKVWTKLDLDQKVRHSAECPGCGHRFKVRLKIGTLLKFLHRKGLLIRYLAHLNLLTLH